MSVKKGVCFCKESLGENCLAKKHVKWAVGQWSIVFLSDEPKFNLFGLDSRCKLWHPNADKYKPHYQMPTVEYGGGNILLWGPPQSGNQFTDTKPQALWIDLCIHDIVEKATLLYARAKTSHKWTFHQDDDPKCSSKVLWEWFVKKKVNALKWLSWSPDLNPIKHLWGEMGRHLGSQHFSNASQLFEKLQKNWSEISSNISKTQCHSVVRRF